MTMPINIRDDDHRDAGRQPVRARPLPVPIDHRRPDRAHARHPRARGRASAPSPRSRSPTPIAGILNRLPTAVITQLFGGDAQGRRLRHEQRARRARSPCSSPARSSRRSSPFGPLSGAAINITLLSYLDDLHIGVNMRPRRRPRPRRLRRVPRRGLRRGPQGGLTAARCSSTSSSSAAARPARPPPSRSRAPGREVVVVDRATFPRDKCCGDGLTAGALRQLEALGLEPVVGAVVAGGRRRRGALAVGPRRCDFPLPRGRGQYAAVARRADSTPLRRRGAAPRARRCTTATRCTGAVDRGDRRRARRRRHRHRRPPTTRSAPTACGRRCARRSAAAEPGYLGEWHAFRQYFTGVSPGAAGDCGCGSSPTCCPATRGRSRCRTAAPTSASASSAASGVPTRHMNDLWPELLRRPHIARRARRRRRGPRARTRPGPSPPASTTRCSPPDVPCSSATRPRPPTR